MTTCFNPPVNKKYKMLETILPSIINGKSKLFKSRLSKTMKCFMSATNVGKFIGKVRVITMTKVRSSIRSKIFWVWCAKIEGFGPKPFVLETMVFLKVDSHPCYSIIWAWFLRGETKGKRFKIYLRNFEQHQIIIFFNMITLLFLTTVKLLINIINLVERGLASTTLFIIPDFFLHFPNKLSYGYLRFEGNGKIPLGR